MEGWNDIINTALLGTEKKSLAGQAGTSVPQTGAHVLQQAMAQITDQAGLDKEEQFLQLAALSFNVRQSGTKPLRQPMLKGTQAAAESLTYCSQSAAQALNDILEEESQPVLVLWLERCIAAQRIIPPELVPTLLNRAIQHKDLRQSVATVCGRRGEWLSRFNPAWEFSNTADDEQLWQTGSLDQSLFDNRYLEYRFKIDTYVGENVFDTRKLSIIQRLCSDLKPSTDGSVVEIRYLYLLDFMINLRNRYFHFQYDRSDNISNLQFDSEAFFESLNDKFANWLALIYFEIMTQGVYKLNLLPSNT